MFRLFVSFKMKTGIKVGDIMTRNFVSAKPDTNLIDCAKEMVKKRVGSLVVKDGQKLVGVLTERDILWAMIKKPKAELENVKAQDIATKKIVAIKPSADVYEALQKMKKQKYRRLPVVFKGNVVGLLTINDILRIQPELFETAVEIMQIREESDKIRRMHVSKGAGKAMDEGMCEECGNYDLVSKIDDRLLCESCREEM